MLIYKIRNLKKYQSSRRYDSTGYRNKGLAWSDIVNTNKKIVKNNTVYRTQKSDCSSAIPAKPTDDLNSYTAIVAISDKGRTECKFFY